MSKFAIQKYTRADKTILILHEGDYNSNYASLVINVDFDDVHHDQVEKDVQKMVSILNKHWDD